MKDKTINTALYGNWLCRLLLILSAVLLAAPSVYAENGSLKVTSFPSGAEVIIDGVNTGKLTPMSTSLSVGDHTVTVQIRGSGWNPDTRTVTIVTGNNDLSVTLLPNMSAYYTKAEVDALLAAYYTKAEVDAQLASIQALL